LIHNISVLSTSGGTRPAMRLISSMIFDTDIFIWVQRGNEKAARHTENIGHRASIYIEEHILSSGLRSGDAIIAATAAENNMPLFSSNTKHFRMIKELKLKVFKP
jgi:predicted nucleic acid-binding protein